MMATNTSDATSVEARAEHLKLPYSLSSARATMVAGALLVRHIVPLSLHSLLSGGSYTSHALPVA